METTCIMCPIGCSLKIVEKDGKIVVTGNSCKRGEIYGIAEYTCPMRSFTSLVFTKTDKVISVKASDLVPKSRIKDLMECLKTVRAKDNLEQGAVIINNILDLNVDLVKTSNLIR